MFLKVEKKKFLYYNYIMEIKEIVIQEGAIAWYHNWYNKEDQTLVELCNFQEEESGFSFCAKYKGTSKYILRDGKPRRWMSIAIQLGTFKIKDVVNSNGIKYRIKIDLMKEKRQELHDYFVKCYLQMMAFRGQLF